MLWLVVAGTVDCNRLNIVVDDPKKNAKSTSVNRMDQTRRLDWGSKADCSLKYAEDLRLADVASNVRYRYLNNKSWEIECL